MRGLCQVTLPRLGRHQKHNGGRRPAIRTLGHPTRFGVGIEMREPGAKGTSPPQWFGGLGFVEVKTGSTTGKSNSERKRAKSKTKVDKSKIEPPFHGTVIPRWAAKYATVSA